MEEFRRRKDGIAYLLKDGNLKVPCSRYGNDTETCAPVAWRFAFICNREAMGKGNVLPITELQLDHAMSLVVNNHDDVAYIIRNYGWRKYQ